MCVPLSFVCGLISRIKFNIENTPWPDALISAHQRVCWVIHRAFPVVLLHDKVEEPHEDIPFLGYVLLRWLLQIIFLITPLSRRTCLDHSIEMNTSSYGKLQVELLFFILFYSFSSSQCSSRSHTPRDQGYGMKVTFYPISMTLSSVPGLKCEA